MILPRCTEGHNVVCSGASYNTGRVVKCIAVCCWAYLFETLGIICRQTCHRVSVHSSTAILICVENITCTSASYDLPIGLEGKLCRAILQQISIAASSAAIAFAIKSSNANRHIKAIYKANVIKINLSKSKLRNGGGRSTRASAIDGATTATCLACAIPIFVKTAASSSPYAASPPG